MSRPVRIIKTVVQQLPEVGDPIVQTAAAIDRIEAEIIALEAVRAEACAALQAEIDELWTVEEQAAVGLYNGTIARRAKNTDERERAAAITAACNKPVPFGC